MLRLRIHATRLTLGIFAICAGLLGAVTSLSAVEPSMASKVNAATDEYRKATGAAMAAYRKSFSEAIAGATKVEVYLLDFETITPESLPNDAFWDERLPEDQFPIVPYGQVSKILNRKRVTSKEIVQLMPSLKATIAVEENYGGALCHFPVHGIRIWTGDKLVFQTSICYKCTNFYMTYPSGASAWTGLSQAEFQRVMEQLMPIPQTELDRFAKKYGPKNSK